MPTDERPSEETKLLREEVEQQRHEAIERDARAKREEELKNRVSVAAIILTTALSFIGNVKGDRADAASGARRAATEARARSAELWTYYQTKLAERTSVELARDRLDLDFARRGAVLDNPARKLEALDVASYGERVRAFDATTGQVFFRVQDLNRDADVSDRAALEPAHAVTRYELGSKLLTLALILLSVTILSGKRWLFWSGVLLGSIGLSVALDGYFLFL